VLNIRSLRLCCWIITSVVLFCKDGGFSFTVHLWCLVACGVMVDILRSETCWAHKKWNKTASDMKLVFYSSTTTMMHGPINIMFKSGTLRQDHLLILNDCTLSRGELITPIMWIKINDEKAAGSQIGKVWHNVTNPFSKYNKVEDLF